MVAKSNSRQWERPELAFPHGITHERLTLKEFSTVSKTVGEVCGEWLQGTVNLRGLRSLFGAKYKWKMMYYSQEMQDGQIKSSKEMHTVQVVPWLFSNVLHKADSMWILQWHHSESKEKEWKLDLGIGKIYCNACASDHYLWKMWSSKTRIWSALKVKHQRICYTSSDQKANFKDCWHSCNSSIYAALMLSSVVLIQYKYFTRKSSLRFALNAVTEKCVQKILHTLQNV